MDDLKKKGSGEEKGEGDDDEVGGKKRARAGFWKSRQPSNVPVLQGIGRLVVMHAYS